MSLYNDYPQLWAPTELLELFILKVPPDLTALTRRQYLDLMELRVMWLIQDWSENMSSDRQAVQIMLNDTIYRLQPTQETPSLQQPAPEWQQAWATTLIRQTAEFCEHPAISRSLFPLTPMGKTHPQYHNLLDIHNSINLSDWLTTLISLYNHWE